MKNLIVVGVLLGSISITYRARAEDTAFTKGIQKWFSVMVDSKTCQGVQSFAAAAIRSNKGKEIAEYGSVAGHISPIYGYISALSSGYSLENKINEFCLKTDTDDSNPDSCFMAMEKKYGAILLNQAYARNCKFNQGIDFRPLIDSFKCKTSVVSDTYGYRECTVSMTCTEDNVLFEKGDYNITCTTTESNACKNKDQQQIKSIADCDTIKNFYKVKKKIFRIGIGTDTPILPNPLGTK